MSARRCTTAALEPQECTKLTHSHWQVGAVSCECAGRHTQCCVRCWQSPSCAACHCRLAKYKMVAARLQEMLHTAVLCTCLVWYTIALAALHAWKPFFIEQFRGKKSQAQRAARSHLSRSQVVVVLAAAARNEGGPPNKGGARKAKSPLSRPSQASHLC